MFRGLHGRKKVDINVEKSAQIMIVASKILTHGLPQISITESKQTIHYVYFLYFCYYGILMS